MPLSTKQSGIVLAIFASGCLVGFLLGRKYPVHRFEHLTGSYMFDTATGRICNGVNHETKPSASNKSPVVDLDKLLGDKSPVVDLSKFYSPDVLATPPAPEGPPFCGQ
jgi:hypothetical protein